MANGTLSDEVLKRKTADALNGDPDDNIDPDDSADDVSSGATDTEPTEAASEDFIDQEETPEPVRAPKGKVQTFDDYGGAPSIKGGGSGTGTSANVPLFQNPSTGSYEPLIQNRLYDVPQEEGGGQYVIDQDTGQQVPRAQAATAEDLAAQPPTQGAVALPQVTVQASGEPAPDTLTQVERGQLIKVPPGTTPRAVAVPKRAESITPGKIVMQAAPAAVQTFDDYPVPRALPSGAAPPVRPAGSPDLATARQPFLAELQNPETLRLLMASTQAEVGGQGYQAQQAYIESVMNRAAALGRTLQSVLTDTHYYPSATINQLGASVGGRAAQNYQNIINSVLNGSNISNLATGNESGDVHSGGAQVTFASQGERFVRENNTLDWIKGIGGVAQAKPQREVQGFDDYGPQQLQPQAPAMRSLTPDEQAAAQARVQAGIQKQQDIVSKLPEASGENIIGFYKRLNHAVVGGDGTSVSLPMRQAIQANLKPQIVSLMQQKFPGLSDADAWTKAQSDVNPLDVGREWIMKALGYGQQFTNVMQQGVAGSDQLHVNQFLESALPGTSDSEKHAFLVQLYQMDPAQRAQIIQAYLPQQQAGMPSTDPQQIVSALDRLSDPNFQKQQAADLAKAKAEMQRNVSDDPRLAGTGMEKVVDATAQLPAFLAAFSNPLLMPVAMAQVSDQVHEQLKAEHPDWDEQTLQDRSAYATLVQFYGQEAAAKIMIAGGRALLRGVQSPAKRAIAQAVLGAGGVTGAGALTQAGTNIVTGQPIGKGVGEAALTGLIQGGVTGLAHGAGEFRRRAEVPQVQPVTEKPAPAPPVTEERPSAPQPVTEQAPAQPPPPTIDPSRVTQRVASDEVHWVPTAQVQQAWNTPGKEAVYIPPGGTENTIGSRYPDAINHVQSDAPTNALEATVRPDGTIDFTDGRHRFAAMRDLGVDQVPLALDEESIKNAQATGLIPSPEEVPYAPKSAEDLSKPPTPENPTPHVVMGPDDPIVSEIANRYRDERIARGELGQVDPSEGKSTEEMVMKGLEMSPKKRETLIGDMVKGKGGNLDDQMAALRSKELLLSQQNAAASREAEADPANVAKQQAARDALQAVTDFHNGPLKEGKRIWSDSGRALQQKIPVDYTTVNGLKEAYLKNQEKAPNAKMEQAFQKTAKSANDVAAADRRAMSNLSKGIGEYVKRGKALTDDQIREEAMRVMKNYPC